MHYKIQIYVSIQQSTYDTKTQYFDFFCPIGTGITPLRDGGTLLPTPSRITGPSYRVIGQNDHYPQSSPVFVLTPANLSLAARLLRPLFDSINFVMPRMGYQETHCEEAYVSLLNRNTFMTKLVILPHHN